MQAGSRDSHTLMPELHSIRPHTAPAAQEPLEFDSLQPRQPEALATLQTAPPLARSFDRDNLTLRVDTFDSKDRKNEALLRRVEFADKPGIVYVATHKNAETIAADLQQIGVDAAAWHGGLKPREREEIQNRFLHDELPVVVATSEFDPGADREDIRFVYHADVSDSLDAYAEEIGRAGRDGKPAEAVLFYRSQDISAQQFKTIASRVDAETMETVFNAIARHRKPVTREKVSEETGFSVRKLVSVLQRLEETGAVQVVGETGLRVANKRPFAEVIEEAEHQQQQHRELRKRRLQQMQSYAETRGCRRECLLRHFGVSNAGPCGHCDRCEEHSVFAKAA